MKRKGKWVKYEGEKTVIIERPGHGEGERFIVSKEKGSDYHITTILRDNPEYAGKPMTGRYAEVVDIHRTNEKAENPSDRHENLKDKKFWV